jgi:two-component system C4-dicarboxylate transport sensor histidine kinase DctB
MRLKRHFLSILALLLSMALVAATYLVAARQGAAEVLARGGQQLQLMAPELESALEKFETLPYVLALQDNVAAVLAHPDDAALVDRLNRTLQTIQQQSRVGAIYLMDRNGKTLAASNWNMPLTFIAMNFKFRPYFRDALNGSAGRFYGIGSATNEPGYFLSQPVRRGGAVQGVIAVKISLDEFERNWAGTDDAIVLADRVGVVFLSNRHAWKYHSLAPLSAATRGELAATLQYANGTIDTIPVRLGAHARRAVGRLGWQLMLIPAPQRSARNASLWALGCALVLLSAALSLWALYQRRRRLEERQAARAALQRAADELDVKLAERTGQLREANHELEQKYATLKETEHVLRSTQDELVQAGKLAMLGQMAAGMTHELNQPLAAIRAFADNARTFLARGQGEQASANLGHIADASARMGAIIGQLKGFARNSRSVSTVNLGQSLRASAFLLRSEFERLDVHLAMADDTALPALLVTGDAVRIEQVLINLLRNALDAVEDAPQREVVATLAREDGAAVVRIADSGTGIAGEVASHLFEPFFTTKPSGKGLGLGLAISSSIVQAMNGELTGRNRSEGGAEFTLRLPLPDTGE